MKAMFVSAHDVLMPRGNRAFGEAGEHGIALALPWPSAFAGALRSALLAANPPALAAFPARPSGTLGDVLGTPASPGSFRLRWLSLALRDRAGRLEPVLPLPADRVAFAVDKGVRSFRALRPAPWPQGIRGSNELPLAPLLRGAPQGKAASAWLTGRDALRAYLDDDAVPPDGVMPALWATELRLGIALDTARRTAQDGALYTTQALRFARLDEPAGRPAASDAGYLVAIEGDQGLLPDSGTLRLGGDGRAARHETVPFGVPQPPLDRIERDRRFKLVLLTPAIWPQGWLPPRLRREGDAWLLDLGGLRARLACAATPRHEVISGWDLVQRQPKAAQRAVPAGSVFWFDLVEGDLRKLAEWVAGGLWPENADTMRRAEGFNNALLGAWKE
jgi:CRISPR-associated protein Cmr3